ncbi:MAG: trypsin-like peptidase domain-containing protein [Opitutaceae bacterium]
MKKSILAIILIFCAVFVAVLCAQKGAFELALDSTPMNREDPKYLTSYAPVLKHAKDAVVAVHSAQILRVYRSRGMDPREQLLRRYFGLPMPEPVEPEVEERRAPQGVGSGVVISADGHILTNNHVISSESGEAADEILVELTDGRELVATVVGRDPRSDLAVLKVEAEDLTFLPIADSDQLEVGDIVFAMGNPMGIGLTITQGIVSATGRSHLSILGESGYESFIQTDAPINPGNSGGALIDATGRLVGINTAILSRSGGSIGLGFAIPSTFARKVALALINEGEMRRGVLGVNIEDVNADFAEVFALPDTSGALVQSVIKGLPAEQAGLASGDVVVALNGRPIADATTLRLKIGEFAPGQKLKLEFYRDGSRQSLTVELSDPEDPYGLGDSSGRLLSGVDAAILNEKWRKEFGLPKQLNGLVVTSVANDSPYAEIFQSGIVLLEINGVIPKTIEEAQVLLKQRNVGRLYVYYQGRRGYLSIRVD